MQEEEEDDSVEGGGDVVKLARPDSFAGEASPKPWVRMTSNIVGGAIYTFMERQAAGGS